MGNKLKSDNTIIKDAVALFIITLIAGLLLGIAYQVTKDPIKVADNKAKQEAYQKVFPGASKFEAEDKLTKAVSKSTSFFEKSGITGADLTEVLVAKNNAGEMLGYVMSITAKEGYGGDIKLSMGMNSKGAITGLEVLSMKETAGLGAKCTEDSFKGQYVGINSDKVILTKQGKSEDNEIDAMTGATITSSAVTKAVNAGIAFIKQDYASAQNK